MKLANHLLDVAAIAATLGGVFLLLDGASSKSRQPLMVVNWSSDDFKHPSSNHDDFEQLSIDEGQTIHHAIDVVAFYEEDSVQNATYYEENRAAEQETPHQQPIDVGDVVELYGPHSSLAIPVIVKRRESDDNGEILYSLIQAETGKEMPTMVNSSYVHGYEPYEDGTNAVCTLDQGLRKKPTSTPCRVIQHKMSPKSIDGRSFPTYQVTYVNVSGENIEIYLPFVSVVRLRTNPSLAFRR